MKTYTKPSFYVLDIKTEQLMQTGSFDVDPTSFVETQYSRRRSNIPFFDDDDNW